MPSESVTLRRMATSGEYSSTEEAIFDGAAAELERMSALLDGRDNFIVQQGLWSAFVAQLPE